MKPFIIIKTENEDLEKQVSNLVSALKTKSTLALLALGLFINFTSAAQDLPLANGQEYTIGEIEVTGNVSFNEQTIIAYTGLKKGEKIFIPGDRISKVLKKLWDVGSFSDVNIYVTNIEGNVADLELEIQEVPALANVRIQGIKKKKQEEFIKENKLNKGTKVTENLLTTTKNYIQNTFKEEGFLNTKVAMNTVPAEDTLNRNTVNLVINVDKGERVKIEDIEISGNEAISDGRLKRAMKKTKEQKFFRFWKRSKFIPEEYEADKQKLLSIYKERGYRDARIVSDSLIRVDEDDVALHIDLEEGNRYFFGDIEFVGNSVYTDQELKRRLGISKGDVYNGVLLEKQIADNTKPDANDLTNLYQNNGYLFSNINPVEVKVYNDTIDFEIRIREGKVAYFDEITVVGNDKTKDHVIFREMRTKPGHKYSKEAVVRTVRELGQLGFFDAENLTPDFKEVDQNSGTVDLEYSVVEAGASQIELQGGYGGGGFVGTLGLSFNNFSLSGLFDKDAYRPLPMGDGQTLSLRAQASTYYQTYSLSFSEPWWGGKKPVRLSTSLQHTEQYFYDYRNREADKDRKFSISGITLGLARRLTVPDDFFVLSTAVAFQHYNLSNYNTGLFTFGDGYSNNFSLTLGLTRDNTFSNPIFPMGGSKFEIIAKLTPPYSLFNDIDYANLGDQKEYQLQNENGVLINSQGRPLRDGEDPVPDQAKIDQEKYKWLEFYKIKFNGTWFTNLYDKLVLRTHAEYGFLGAYNNDRGVPPFERFYLGGDGMGTYSMDGREAIALRGYPNQSLIPVDRGVMSTATDNDGATIYNKYSLELRYPITLKPTASIYGLTFLEAGASFDDFKDYNPFQINRSAGAGIRIFMPAFGLLGIDFGYGFDPLPGESKANGWETHFIIGQQF
ncbi:outer membrane protein assembly factor BamA [Salinimicrobium tongyeongense]|uniref:Outer membrane protein assembly factor BamA n=1 Tax=Salinimicrobium tongyeongense TaxID=2809707 RepID=A0ABY6NTM4_9FLAO|nr:outer membrane protein assembly factor BamA [Salinimicrobium tongyeongense]UZH56264.1 outer membrane protein assembly factor BamA [Salinimicrobium tongyeongense]